VLQHPTYAAKYPLGLGLFLAAGKVLGHPWIGVLMASALAGLAFFWCLKVVLPPEWALAGALFGGIRYLGLSYWASSYWGGAPAALAGALLFGGLLRWLKQPRGHSAAIGALGWSLLWLIRPAESAGLALVCLVGLLAWQIRGEGAPWRTWIRQLLLPAGAVFLATLALTLAHNRAVTGEAWRLPYQQAQIDQGVPQGFIFQRLVGRPPMEFKDQRDAYEWQLGHRIMAGRWPDGLVLAGRTVALMFNFYCGLALLLVLLAGMCKPIDNGLEYWAWGVLMATLAGECLYPYPLTHYLAANSVVALLLFTAAARRLLDRRAVAHWARAAAFAGLVIASMLEYHWTARYFERGPAPRAIHARYYLGDWLEKQPGQHLVLVHYGPKHDFGTQWIYNRAEVDSAKVVWARDISPADNQPLLKYFSNRQAWRVEADAPAPQLERVNGSGQTAER
jgi:hypothetical protein